MKVGFGQVEFTPLEGYMPGEFWPFYATSKFTPLMANAAAFTSDEGDSVILVSVDCVHIATDRATYLRKKIANATGVPAENVLMASTHTHTGASDQCISGLCPAEPDTALHTERRVVEAAVAAWNSREDAKFGVGRGEERRMSFNRDCVMKDGRIVSIPGRAAAPEIDHYLGVVDYDVFVMRIEDADGKIKGFIVNYANHPDNHKKRKFSGDFPAYMRQALKEKFGEDITVLFLNGACGDVNAFDYKNSTDWYQQHGQDNPPMNIGNMLAETVIAINEGIAADITSAPVKVASDIVTFDARVPADWEMKEALENKKLMDAGEEVNRHVWSVTNRTLVYNDPTTPLSYDVFLQALRIGPWAIVSVPVELYAELGLKIKADSPVEMTLVAENTNGGYGYLPPDSTLGTTAYGGRYYAGRLGHGSDKKMVDAAVELIKELV